MRNFHVVELQDILIAIRPLQTHAYVRFSMTLALTKTFTCAMTRAVSYFGSFSFSPLCGDFLTAKALAPSATSGTPPPPPCALGPLPLLEHRKMGVRWGLREGSARPIFGGSRLNHVERSVLRFCFSDAKAPGEAASRPLQNNFSARPSIGLPTRTFTCAMVVFVLRVHRLEHPHEISGRPSHKTSNKFFFYWQRNVSTNLLPTRTQ